VAAVNETKLREALVSGGLCDREMAVAVGEVVQEVWSEATIDFATDDKIAVAIGDLRSSLLEALQESERIQVERHEHLRQEVLEFRKEVAERDERLRQEILGLHKDVSERDGSLRQEIADRDERLRHEIADRDERLRKEIADRDERLRHEIAEHDDRLRKDIADRDAHYREDQAARDRRTQWLIGLGFTAFGALASVLAVFT